MTGKQVDARTLVGSPHNSDVPSGFMSPIITPKMGTMQEENAKLLIQDAVASSRSDRLSVTSRQDRRGANSKRSNRS